jgi:protein involved in polysaccharide export with SLBB domain
MFLSRFHSAAARALPPLVLASLLAAWPAAGQRPVSGRDTLAQRERTAQPAAPLLDRPVVRSEYQLGPGDVVNVTVFGEVEMSHTLTVTPEGTLVVPSIGVVRVLGANLDEAQARVRTAVFRLYREVDVTLALTQVRSFKVYLVGDVPNPGVVTATSVTRASEVIPTAGRASPSHRNILLRRAAGDSMLVDLARFTLLGDLSSNPTLREGDALLLRTVVETVQVTGPVSFPGVYEYRAGESLASLLTLTTGGRGLPAFAGDTVRVSRVTPGGGRRTLLVPASGATGSAGAALLLQPYDAIYVQGRSRFARQQSATVQGEVFNPGTYPIHADTTTLRDLIALGGGLTDRASLEGATLRRQPVGGSRIRTGDQLAPDSSLTSAERDVRRLESASAEDANYVVLDLARILGPGGEAYDIRLQTGDVLHVPERRQDVAVVGAVVRPGLVGYAPGRSVNEYVNLAGGYLRRAAWKDAVVLRTSTGARLAVGDVERLEPGDRIIVPFRERRTLVERLQTTQTITAIVSGLLITLITVRQL